MTYAGFWKRFAAYLIDMIVIYIIVAIVGGILAKCFDVSQLGQSLYAVTDVDMVSRPGLSVSLVVGIVMFLLFAFLFPALYFILQEGSRKQATLGKRCLGIKVCDLRGAPISRWRAFGRFFCKTMSGYVLIGYIIAAFTPRKQAMHDLMVDSIVVNAPRTHQVPAEHLNAAAQADAA